MMRPFLQKYFGNRIYQYLAALTGTLGILSCEMHYGWTSPSLPILIKGGYRVKISTEEGSWLVISLLIGTITGAIMTGYLADLIGRKKIILFSSIPIMAGWLLIGFATRIEHLFAARSIAGLSVGISLSVVPMYLGEIAEPSLRGMLTSLCPVCVVFGILLINILGNYLPIDTAAFVSSIPPLILFVTFMGMPESPTYLLINGKVEEAKVCLEILLGPQSAEAELNRLQTEVNKELEDKKKGYKILFTDKANRKALLIAVGLRTLQQLCGTTVITFYCKSIFEETKELILPHISSIIYFSLQLFVAIISSLIVDCTGRRILLLISITGTGLSLLTTGLYFHLKNGLEYDTKNLNFVPVVSLFLYVIFFNIGVRTIPLLMVGEIFSSNVKSSAVSLTAIYFSLLSIATSKFFHYTNQFVGMHVPFYTFASLCLSGLYFIHFYIPETKGKTLEEIQQELRGEILEPIVITRISYLKNVY